MLFEEKEKVRKLQESRKVEEEQRKRKRDHLNKFDDERDLFKYPLPMLAPSEFKPLKKHKLLCKICYD